MIDVGDKPVSLRLATAEVSLKFKEEIFSLIKDGFAPKGNIYEVANISGTLGAKKTPDLIPYCHPIPIDSIKVETTIERNFIRITVKVKSIWNTGVEMEALTGASIAALSVYDILKPLDASVSIENTRLIEKHGGIGDFMEKKQSDVSAAIITISDTRTKAEDRSGKILIETLKKHSIRVVDYKILPDDKEIIKNELLNLSDNKKVNMIITTGGTGAGPRDVTPEATRDILEKEMNGIEESLRSYGQKRTPLSMLSRGVSGIRGNTLIINMPGSSTAVTQSLNTLFPGIMHIFRMIAGDTNHQYHDNH